MIKFLLIVCVGVCLALAADYDDQVKYDISTQSRCFEVIRRESRRCEWRLGLYHDIDYRLLNGRIAAYKILWSRDRWSEWYVPGINDIDTRFNLFETRCGGFYGRRNTIRRMWSYFYDYTHKYIICRYDNVFTGKDDTGFITKDRDNRENDSENDD